MKLLKLWPAFVITAGFIACGGSSDEDTSGTTGGASTGARGGSGGKSSGGSGKGGTNSSGGSVGSSGDGGTSSSSGGVGTAGTGNEAGTTSTAGTTGAAGQGGATSGSGGAGGEPAAVGGAGGGPGCVNLTIKNYQNWCVVSVSGGAYTEDPSGTRTVCVDPGTIDVAAKAKNATFEIGTIPWHFVDGDPGGTGVQGSLSGSGVNTVSAAQKTVSGDACIWVCCQFSASHDGCAVANPCP